MITRKACCAAIGSLVNYGISSGLMDEMDKTYAVNTLLREMGLEAYEDSEEYMDFPACLEILCDFAVEKG